MTNTNETTRGLVTCPKCDGKKYFHVFSNIANGKCFMCAGAGKIEANIPSVATRLRAAADWLVYNLVDDMTELGHVRPFYLEKAVAALFALNDKEAARRILDNNARTPAGKAVRAVIVEAGRAAKVA